MGKELQGPGGRVCGEGVVQGWARRGALQGIALGRVRWFGKSEGRRESWVVGCLQRERRVGKGVRGETRVPQAGAWV